MIRLMRNMREAPGLHQAYLAPTYGLVADIFYPRFEDFLERLCLPYSLNRKDNIFTIDGLGQVFCRSLDRPQNLIGWEVGDIFIDEFDTMDMDKALWAFRRLTARARQPNPTGRKNQIFITTTPEGFKATHKLFVKDPLPDSRLIRMSTWSNAHNLPDDYITSLQDQYPDNLFQAYLLGEFVNMKSGQVYYTFNRHNLHTKRTVKRGEPLHIGFDFNVANMAAVVFVGDKDRPLQAVDEFVGYYDTPDMIAAIKNRYKNHRVYAYPDASGDNRATNNASKTDIKLLKLAGFTVRARKHNPPVKDRVQSVNKVISDGLFRINTETCPETTEALEQQAYAKNGTPDKTSGYDHVCFAGDTVVLVNGRYEFIRDIPEFGVIDGPFGEPVPYENAGLKQKAVPTLTIELHKQGKITCTPDHKFLTPNGWVQAQHLKPDDKLLLGNVQAHLDILATSPQQARTAVHAALASYPNKCRQVASITPGPVQDVYCLTTALGCFALGSGIVVSNCDALGYRICYHYLLSKPVLNYHKLVG